MKKIECTVIIPTYNRADKLNHCLKCLFEQSLPKSKFEVIVVDDGSNDHTQQILKKWASKWPKLQHKKQKNRGQGVARNKALKLAKGELILFIGDDIYPTKDFLKTHVQFHKKNPQINRACLGLTEWDPDKNISPYMKWLVQGPGAPQFAYYKLKPNKTCNFWFFYTSNISLKKVLLQKEQFDTNFKGYGWEDIELAYRLKKKLNLKIIYKPKALAYHDHPMSPKDLKKRMQSIGRNLKPFQSLHPELKILPKGIKKIILRVISSYPSIILARLMGKKFYWYTLSKRYFLQGLKQ